MGPFVRTRGRWTSAASMVTWLSISTFILVSQVESQLVIEQSPKNATVSVGESVILTCVFSVPVDCNWLKDDQPYRIRPSDGNTYTGDSSTGEGTRDCSIIINSVTEDDFVKWRCATYASKGLTPVSSEDIWITKRVRSQQLDLVQWSPNTPAVIGQSLTLACVFNTSVRCTWNRASLKPVLTQKVSSGGGYSYDGDNKATKDCSLTIDAVEEQDFTMWFCTGLLNNKQVYSPWTYITEQVTPSAPVIWFNNATASSIELPSPDPPSQMVCSSDKGNPPPSLYWEVNGITYSGKSKTTPAGTNLYTVQLRWDRGIEWKTFANIREVICKANHPGFTNTKVTKVELRHQYAPRTVKIVAKGFNDDNIAIGRGANVTLSCISDGHPPPSTYTWELWSEEDGRWKSYSLNEQSITVTIGQLGKYRCKASNGLNRHSPTTSLNQLNVTESIPPSAPVIMFNNDIVSVIELPSPDPPSHMVCRSPKGNPPPQLQWEVNGTRYLGRTETIDVGAYLYVNELHWDRGGGWHIFDNANEVICTAKYIGLTNAPSARIKFNHNHAPNTVKVRGDGFICGNVTSASVALTCISDGHHQPTAYIWEWWSDEDQLWKLYNNTGHNEQTISVTIGQLGKYRCRASNGLNRHSPTTSVDQTVVSEQTTKPVEDVKQEEDVPSGPQELNSNQFFSVVMSYLSFGERKSSGASDNRETNGSGVFISIDNQIVISGSNLISAVEGGEPGPLVTSCDSGPNVTVANIRLVERGASKLGFAWDPLPSDQSNGPLAYRYVLRTVEEAPEVTVALVNGTTGDTKVTIEHLTAFTRYQLSLSGFNSGGEGPMVTSVHRTLDKGN